MNQQPGCQEKSRQESRHQQDLQELADNINLQRIQNGFCPSQDMMGYDSFLVVYGRLSPELDNQHILAPLKGQWLDATIIGELVEQAVDSKWPGMRFGGDAVKPTEVKLFSSNLLSEHWDEIDIFKGDKYQRLLVPVTQKDGGCLLANIYALREDG